MTAERKPEIIAFGTAAELAAAAHCLLARSRSARAVTGRHPRPCVWCHHRLDDLQASIDAAYRPSQLPGDTRSFLADTTLAWSADQLRGLPGGQQLRAVEEAQGFDLAADLAPKPEPMPTTPDPAADAEWWAEIPAGGEL